MRLHYTICLLVLFSLISKQGFSKEVIDYKEFNSPKVIITMYTGEEWNGKLVEAKPNAPTISILTPQNEKLVFSIAEVKAITQELEAAPKYDLSNPFNGEYFLISSSFPYEKSNLYVRFNVATFASIDYAITKNFSIGAGGFFLDGLKNFPVFARMKVSVPITDHFCIAVGGLGARFGKDLTGGLAYASASLGTEDIHISGGIAYGFVNEELIPYPAFILGAKVRFANNFAVITDNLVSPVNDDDVIGMSSLGLRFFISHIAIDGGVMTPFASGYFTLDKDVTVLPFAKITARIGK